MAENNNNVESISDEEQEEEKNDIIEMSKKIRLAHRSVHDEFTQINA